MNNLLNKFQAVTISNDNRISEKDRAYCEKHEKMYLEAVTAMKQALNSFQSIFDNNKTNEYDSAYRRGYIDQYDDINKMKDRITKVKNDFISNILYHFQDQYSVTLSSADIKVKYKEKEITYQNVIDEIFEQLGGFNFNEKAVKELKDKSRETVYNKDHITVKKSKLILNNFIWWDSYSWEGKKLGYSDSKVKPLFAALSHFETGETETEFYYNSIYTKLYEGEKKNDIFSKFDLGYNIVKSIKCFKNGKLEIEFESMEQALEFSKEYLEQ